MAHRPPDGRGRGAARPAQRPGAHALPRRAGAADLGVGTVVTGTPHYTQVLGDYFTRPVDEAPRGGCPYRLNLDTIGPAAPALLTEPPAAPPSSTNTPAATATATPTATLTRTTPKPALRALALSPSRFRAGRRGTTISYTLSVPATVTFRIQRARQSGTGRAVRSKPGSTDDRG